MGLVTYPFRTQIADESQHRQVKSVGIGEPLVHEDIQAFFSVPLNDPQRVCVFPMRYPLIHGDKRQDRLSGALCKASEMRRIRRAKSSDPTPFEDKASNTNRRHEENSDGDSVRNNFAIFSSRLHRSVYLLMPSKRKITHLGRQTCEHRQRCKHHVCCDDALQMRFPIFSFVFPKDQLELGHQDCMHGLAECLGA